MSASVLISWDDSSTAIINKLIKIIDMTRI